jgi:hypothetical protein
VGQLVIFELCFANGTVCVKDTDLILQLSAQNDLFNAVLKYWDFNVDLLTNADN